MNYWMHFKFTFLRSTPKNIFEVLSENFKCLSKNKIYSIKYENERLFKIITFLNQKFNKLAYF